MRKIVVKTLIGILIFNVFVMAFIGIKLVINGRFTSEYPDTNNQEYRLVILSLFNVYEPYIVHYNYGNYYYKEERYEEAAEKYRRALKYNIPKERICDVEYNLGLSLLKQVDISQKEEAISLLEEAKKHFSNCADINLKLEIEKEKNAIKQNEQEENANKENDKGKTEEPTKELPGGNIGVKNSEGNPTSGEGGEENSGEGKGRTKNSQGGEKGEGSGSGSNGENGSGDNEGDGTGGKNVTGGKNNADGESSNGGEGSGKGNVESNSSAGGKSNSGEGESNGGGTGSGTGNSSSGSNNSSSGSDSGVSGNYSPKTIEEKQQASGAIREEINEEINELLAQKNQSAAKDESAIKIDQKIDEVRKANQSAMNLKEISFAQAAYESSIGAIEAAMREGQAKAQQFTPPSSSSSRTTPSVNTNPGTSGSTYQAPKGPSGINPNNI